MSALFWPVAILWPYTYTQVRGLSERYTVCGKFIPSLVVGTALLAQAVDGNVTLGNVSIVRSSNVRGGLLSPPGLAVILVIVGI